MKKFIFMIPLQKPSNLKLSIYRNPDNNPLLCSERESIFPITYLINNCVSSGEQIQLFPIFIDHPNTRENYPRFIKEFEALKEAKGFECEIETIETPHSEHVTDHLNLFGKIIDKFSDDDQLYTCITYGTKPIPMILLMALQYAYKFNKDVSIEAIVYGNYDFATEIPSIYEVSALFYMSSAINSLSEQNLKNPLKTIKDILSL